MLCDRCHTREATVHYTQIVNGRRTEEHLCPECAAQSRVMSGGMDSLMHSMFDHSFFQNIWSDPLSEIRNLTCRSCGTTLETFRKEGELGCPDCYETFRDSLKPFFRKSQEGAKHLGKTLETGAVRAAEEDPPELQKLKEQLASLVKEENYEEAAKVRDAIRALNEKDQGDHHDKQ